MIRNKSERKEKERKKERKKDIDFLLFEDQFQVNVFILRQSRDSFQFFLSVQSFEKLLSIVF